MAGPSEEAATCRNCGATLYGPFCATCGQEDQPLDPSLGEFLGEIARSLTDLDGRVLATIGRLFSAPGFLTREYVKGRRTRWMSPIRLYMIVSLVYFGLIAVTGVTGLSLNVEVTGDTAQEEQSQLEQLGFSDQGDLDAAVAEAVRTWLPRAMFLMVPLFGVLVYGLRFRSRTRYPQHLIFSLHVHAAWFAGFAVLGITGNLLEGTVGAALSAVVLPYAAVYLALALRGAYGVGLPRAIVETIVLGVAYWALAFLATLAIVAPLVI